MIQISQTKLLSLWEEGLGNSPLLFSLTLLCETYPGINPSGALLLSIGKRDSLLLKLRRRIFGTHFSGLSDCPLCNEHGEWEFHFDTFGLSETLNLEEDEEYEFKQEGYRITFRLPNTNDLVVGLDEKATGDSYRSILSRCILNISHKRKSKGFEELPDRIINGLSEQMNMNDAIADIRISLTCPQCAHQYEVVFDIISYLWKEVNVWASHLIHEIGVLAFNFGWSEAQILNLSPVKRQMYLEMIET